MNTAVGCSKNEWSFIESLFVLAIFLFLSILIGFEFKQKKLLFIHRFVQFCKIMYLYIQYLTKVCNVYTKCEGCTHFCD